MHYEIRWLAPGSRRPVRLPGCYPGVDVQGCIPAGWCTRCGAELFDGGREVCERCARKERYDGEGKYESLFRV